MAERDEVCKSVVRDIEPRERKQPYFGPNRGIGSGHAKCLIFSDKKCWKGRCHGLEIRQCIEMDTLSQPGKLIPLNILQSAYSSPMWLYGGGPVT